MEKETKDLLMEAAKKAAGAIGTAAGGLVMSWLTKHFPEWRKKQKLKKEAAREDIRRYYRC